MNAINVVLIFKIVITILCLAGPFLFLAREKLEKLTRVRADASTFFRLYGMAMLALAFAYMSGVWTVTQGIFPWAIVAMGVLSNGGATAVLLVLGDRTAKRSIAPVFGGITLGLLLCAAFPDAAMTGFFSGAAVG